jgi:hypothetical protein
MAVLVGITDQATQSFTLYSPSTVGVTIAQLQTLITKLSSTATSRSLTDNSLQTLDKLFLQKLPVIILTGVI